MTDTTRTEPGDGKRDPTASLGALTAVEVASGVNKDGVPFCHITATRADGAQLHGQLDPEVVQEMALAWLTAAEAAASDAAVWRLLHRTVGMSAEASLAFVAHLREERSEVLAESARVHR